MKKGFVSMAIIYTFLIIFLVLLTSFLGSYVNKRNLINKISSEVKEELNLKYHKAGL